MIHRGFFWTVGGLEVYAVSLIIVPPSHAEWRGIQGGAPRQEGGASPAAGRD